jgi:hypothetical protein
MPTWWNASGYSATSAFFVAAGYQQMNPLKMGQAGQAFFSFSFCLGLLVGVLC